MKKSNIKQKQKQTKRNKKRFVRMFQKSNHKIVEKETNSMYLTHIYNVYMRAHSSGQGQTLHL